jgi:hypothetical protein
MLPSVLTAKNKPAWIQEDVRPGLQMTPERFVGTSRGYMCLNAAIDHVAIPVTVSAAQVEFFTWMSFDEKVRLLTTR